MTAPKLFRRILNFASYAPNNFFQRNIVAWAESACQCQEDVLLAKPPIFIIGPPRSGSTLAVQTLINSFGLSYLSNKHAFWFGAPFLISQPRLPPAKVPRVSVVSNFGQTHGAREPAECGEWWYRFFPRQLAHAEGKAARQRLTRFRRSVLHLAGAANSSLIFKNMFASLRIPQVSKVIPEARWIVMNRDLCNIAKSILNARQALHGSYSRWWSLRPPGSFPFDESPPHVQVVEQARQTYQTIESDLLQANIPRNRIHRLSYERLCTDRQASLDEVEAFFATNEIKAVRLNSPDEDRPVKNTSSLPPLLARQIDEYAESIRHS